VVELVGEEAMRELVPDDRLRASLAAELPLLPLSYFEASVALPDGWDARPCACLLLSGQPYGESAAVARERGWPVVEVPGVKHLALATEPVVVTDALVELESELVGLA
jgi:hypothetical protein